MQSLEGLIITRSEEEEKEVAPSGGAKGPVNWEEKKTDNAPNVYFSLFLESGKMGIVVYGIFFCS